MEFKGTKKWTLAPDRVCIRVGKGCKYVPQFTPNSKMTQEEADANAQLIASAPALLKALQNLESEMTTFYMMVYDGSADEVSKDFDKAVEHARKIIKKALGNG